MMSKSLDISPETLKAIYAAENLDAPSVLHWPLSGPAEDDRLRRETYFRQNLAASPPPGLEWISAHRDVKYRPDLILPNCRSVLVTALPYFRNDPEDTAPSPNASIGIIARYARGRDYHKELGKRLKRIVRLLSATYPDDQFRAFTDIGPLDETWLAEASGLGFKGRHTLAIMPKVGSWVVLGHIVSTRNISGTSPRPSPLHCPDGCRRCIDACPTNALSMPGILDPSRCISCHTIEQKNGATDPSYRRAAGNRIFGCDACQEVCPFNFRVVPTTVEGFLQDIAGAGIPLGELLEIGDESDNADGSSEAGVQPFKERFAGSPLMRAGRSGMVRNACTAAGNLIADTSVAGENSADIEPYVSLIKVLKALATDKDEGVREHANWALNTSTA